jgi:hypothetical protein
MLVTPLLAETTVMIAGVALAQVVEVVVEMIAGVAVKVDTEEAMANVVHAVKMLRYKFRVFLVQKVHLLRALKERQLPFTRKKKERLVLLAERRNLVQNRANVQQVLGGQKARVN